MEAKLDDFNVHALVNIGENYNYKNIKPFIKELCKRSKLKYKDNISGTNLSRLCDDKVCSGEKVDYAVIVKLSDFTNDINKLKLLDDNLNSVLHLGRAVGIHTILINDTDFAITPDKVDQFRMVVNVDVDDSKILVRYQEINKSKKLVDVTEEIESNDFNNTLLHKNVIRRVGNVYATNR